MSAQKRCTSRQESQAGKLARDAFASLIFNKEDAQRVLTHPGLASGYKELFQKLAGNGSALATGLVPDGWTVVEDVAATTDLVVASLRPRAILRNGESYIGSHEMRRRAVPAKANWGLADGKRMLEEGLPSEFDGKAVPLPGTKLRLPDGDLCVGCLSQDGDGRWLLNFFWLDDVWRSHDQFACRE